MFFKNIIVGGGPIGLYLASKLDDYLLIEANDFLGGQLSRLYPEKEIVDIPEFKSIIAKDYISFLISKIDLNKVHLNEKVIDIKKENNSIITNKNSYQYGKLFIVTGLGFSSPRKMGIVGEEECSNILYNLNTYDFLKDKKIAIFGGGDSALDWTKILSNISNHVSLIHRRDEFRGDATTINGIKNIDIYLSYVPESLTKVGNICKTINIKSVKTNEIVTLEVDYILVFFGNVVEQNNLPLEKENNFIKVNSNFEASKNIYVLGDASTYENKKRRIAPGKNEVDKLLKLIS